MDAREKELLLSPHAPPQTSEERMDALAKLVREVARDVIDIRYRLDPIGAWRRAGIIAASSFVGGAIVHAILWLFGVAPVWSIVHR